MLERDVVLQDRNAPGVPGTAGANPLSGTPRSMTECTTGNVELRPDKRTRPLVVRSIEGACLTVNFTNLLAPVANPDNAQQDALFNDDQGKGRCVGSHATGTKLVDSFASDGSFVGKNHTGDDILANCAPADTKGSLVGPGGSIVYNLDTPHDGDVHLKGAAVAIDMHAKERGWDTVLRMEYASEQMDANSLVATLREERNVEFF